MPFRILTPDFQFLATGAAMNLILQIRYRHQNNTIEPIGVVGSVCDYTLHLGLRIRGFAGAEDLLGPEIGNQVA